NPGSDTRWRCRHNGGIVAIRSRSPPTHRSTGAATVIRIALGICIIALMTILGLTSATSHATAGEPAPYECRRAEGAITIDGSADEPAWKKASVVNDFGLPWLGERVRPPRTRTTARLLWDDKCLYFFAEMEDADLYADILEH